MGETMSSVDLQKTIQQLKQEHHAIILAHNYQLPEVQDCADIVGDSLELALQATKTDANYIVFCGVDFMAESAKILNPTKPVLFPDLTAECPMACMADPHGIRTLQQKHPNAAVVSYINTTAEVKAVSDVCCTSSNGAKVVNSIEENEIIFVPDQHLGSYVQRFTTKTMILWPGMCPTHHKISKQELLALKRTHANAEILVHPECKAEVIDIADHTFSTNGMVNHVKASSTMEFIIGTEKELCYRLQQENPNKKIFPVHSAICPNMKKITLEKVATTLQTLKPEVKLSPDLMKKARIPLQRMMDIGRGD